MSIVGTCACTISSGQVISFVIHDSNGPWGKTGGLYIFAYRATNGNWNPLYVGQTDDFSSRLPSHERLSEAIKLGATHILVSEVPTQSSRDIWERRLIAYLQPHMNEKLLAARSAY